MMGRIVAREIRYEILKAVRLPAYAIPTLTFPLVLANVDDMQTVSEEAIVDAVRFLFFRAKLVVEPSGALGVAALLSGVVAGYRRVGVVLSGGNVDAETMRSMLAGG